MGFGNAKEKIEDEIMKIRMERAEIQMQRDKQLQLLREIYGFEKKPALIPDYIEDKKRNSSSTIAKEENTKHIRRSHKSKSLAIKNKELKLDEDPTNVRSLKKRHTCKKKTIKF